MRNRERENWVLDFLGGCFVLVMLMYLEKAFRFFVIRRFRRGFFRDFKFLIFGLNF